MRNLMDETTADLIEEHYKNFKDNVARIIRIAGIILPHAIEDKSKDPMVAAFGGYPDTFEWLELKISFLSPDDVEGLVEWQKYIISKVIKSPQYAKYFN